MPGPSKKLKRIEVAEHARFLTCSCYRRLPLFQNDQIKQVFADQLVLARDRLGFELFGWVLMPEHFHLLVRTGDPNLSIGKVLFALKKPLAERVLKRWAELEAPVLDRLLDSQSKPHFWQPGGGYDRNIVSQSEFEEKLNYIHANPVRRGLVACPEAWVWSSARWYQSRDGVPMDLMSF